MKTVSVWSQSRLFLPRARPEPTQFVRSRSRLRDLGLPEPEPPKKVAAPQHWRRKISKKNARITKKSSDGKPAGWVRYGTAVYTVSLSLPLPRSLMVVTTASRSGGP